MNAEHVHTPSDSLAYGSPGAAIRAARTRAGMSLEELASRTRLTRQTLEAMESDAFEQLLEPVYVRGYYRKCARILDIPDQPLVDAYDATYKPPARPVPQRVRLASGGDLGSSPRVSTRFAVLAPVAAVVLISVIWMLRQPATPPGAAQSVTLIDPTLETAPPIVDVAEPAAPTVTAVEIAPAPTAEGAVDPAAVAAVAEPGAATTDAAASAPASSEPAAVATTSEPAAAPAPPPAPPPAPKPVGTQLVLQFDAISWVRVEDAAGKSLLSGVIGAGETQTVDGQPPYAVFLGNAPGVKLSFGGLPFDVQPYLKGNSTARFSVPAASAN